MKMMFDIVNSIGDKFVEVTDKEISKSPIMEVKQILARFTTDVISNVAFGLDSNSNFNALFCRLIKKS